MSVLGKSRHPAQKVMSGLAPKADICSALGHVRFGPIADMRHAAESTVKSDQS
jgi:hypothetical protein